MACFEDDPGPRMDLSFSRRQNIDDKPPTIARLLGWVDGAVKKGDKEQALEHWLAAVEQGYHGSRKRHRAAFRTIEAATGMELDREFKEKFRVMP